MARRRQQRGHRNLGAHGAFVDNGYAKTHNLKVGSPLTLTAPNGKSARLHVHGIFEPPTGGSPFGPVTISDATWDSIYDSPQNLYSFVRMRGGETTRTRRRSTQQLKAFPNAKVQTKEQFIDNQISGLNAILNILYVLLALSVDREPLRDREHARADGLRADARARDAARRRDDAAAGRGA